MQRNKKKLGKKRKGKRKRKMGRRSQILTQERILGNLGKNTRSRKPTVRFQKKERKQKRS